jgi:hypothetical protein
MQLALATLGGVNNGTLPVLSIVIAPSPAAVISMLSADLHDRLVARGGSRIKPLETAL